MTQPIELAPGLAYLRTGIVNVYFAGSKESWVLIDTGVPGSTEKIVAAAEARFGKVRPHAIVLTHGHFDHASCAVELAKFWNVPVYAHPLEFPYLTGQSAYPQKDPTVGGAMAFLSRFFPSRTTNCSEVLLDLPDTRTVPGLQGWMWIEAPGHAPGQVALWHEHNRVLVAGDALATVDTSSWASLMSWKQEIAGPPAPFNYDWELTRASVLALADLRPKILACGHGEPMSDKSESGNELAEEIEKFARQFISPEKGRYVPEAAMANQHGVVYEPPAPPDHLPKVAAGLVAGVFLVAGIFFSRRKKVPTDV